MKQIDTDIHWMSLALEEASSAMEQGELPIGCILVAGGSELGRGQTQVSRTGSMTAHGEILTLLEANGRLFTCERPLELYTTLEPCLMCLGAAINCGVDRIIFALEARPDGGTSLSNAITKSGQQVPVIIPHVMREEARNLMRSFVDKNPEHFGLPYAKLLVADE